MTEDYVSFETAKLLKEKGFDESTNCQYPVGGIHIGEVGEYNITDRSRNPENYIPAPTLQMAMKWLREKHNIVFGINPNDHEGVIKWRVEVYKVYGQNGCLLHEGKWIAIAFLPSYEEAAEAAIKYCLENLV